jgi:hypothetical protein
MWEYYEARVYNLNHPLIIDDYVGATGAAS